MTTMVQDRLSVTEALCSPTLFTSWLRVQARGGRMFFMPHSAQGCPLHEFLVSVTGAVCINVSRLNVHYVSVGGEHVIEPLPSWARRFVLWWDRLSTSLLFPPNARYALVVCWVLGLTRAKKKKGRAQESHAAHETQGAHTESQTMRLVRAGMPVTLVPLTLDTRDGKVQTHKV